MHRLNVYSAFERGFRFVCRDSKSLRKAHSFLRNQNDNSIQGPVVRAMSDGAWDRLGSIFDGVAQDERILAVGLCDGDGNLVEPTKLMPAAVVQTFGINAMKRSGAFDGSCGENCTPDFGRRFVFDAKLCEFELTFPDPVHQFNAGDGN